MKVTRGDFKKKKIHWLGLFTDMVLEVVQGGVLRLPDTNWDIKYAFLMLEIVALDKIL